MAQVITSGLKRRVGDDVQVDVKLVDAIPPEASGKHRYVVSRVKLNAGLRYTDSETQRAALGKQPDLSKGHRGDNGGDQWE